MNIFSAKSIGLYSLAIGSSIVFFNFVTSYGEANIKAPISITGNYLITAENLPECLHHKQLLLKLEQSGIYLNASLVDDRQGMTTISENLPTLSGRLHDRELNLGGLLPTSICPELLQLRMKSLVKIRSATDRKQQLQGQVWFDRQSRSATPPVDFTGNLQPSTRSIQSH
jgi:hypothetical protein